MGLKNVIVTLNDVRGKVKLNLTVNVRAFDCLWGFIFYFPPVLLIEIISDIWAYIGVYNWMVPKELYFVIRSSRNR